MNDKMTDVAYETMAGCYAPIPSQVFDTKRFPKDLTSHLTCKSWMCRKWMYLFR